MRLFLGGDSHCGSIVGLTPPKWQQNEAQAEQWAAYMAALKRRGPFDIGVWAGDMIDGKSERAGGQDVFVNSRREQVLMAQQVIEAVNAPENVLAYGTPYHTGAGEDHEAYLTDIMGDRLHGDDQIFMTCEGVTFNVKHKVGASSIEHGRLTPLVKDVAWLRAWALEKKQHPKCQVIIRGHVHYHRYAGAMGPDWWLAMTLPALQGLGSKFGRRQCSATVDWGFCWMDVKEGAIQAWGAEILTLPSQREKVLALGKRKRRRKKAV